MVQGWLQIDGSWYYFGSSGNMYTGSRQINGRTYYFDPSGKWFA